MLFNSYELEAVQGKKIDKANMYAYMMGNNHVVDKEMFTRLDGLLDESESHILKNRITGKYYSLFVMESDDPKTHYVSEISEKIFQGEIEAGAIDDKATRIEKQGWAEIGANPGKPYARYSEQRWPLAAKISRKYSLGKIDPIVQLKNPQDGVEVGFRLSQLN